VGLLANAFERQGRHTISYRLRHKDGHYLHLEDRGVVLPEQDGQTVRILGTIKDITDRKRIEDEIRSQSRRAQVMAEISQALAELTRNPQQLMNTIVERCAEIIGDGASIFLYDPQKPFLELAAVANPNPEQVRIFYSEMEAHPIRVDESAYGLVISNGQPVLYPVIDIEEIKANASPERRNYYEQLPLYSAMFAPLRAEGRVLGVLGMGRHHADHASYTSYDLNFLQDIADRAAMALLNAQLYTTLEERVQQRTAELEAANRELEAYSYSVSHDLRGPLRAIDGYSQLLVTDYADRLDLDGHTFITRIRESAQRMGKLIDDILTFSHLSRYALQKQPVNLGQLAEESMRSLLAAYPGVKIDFQLGALPVAEADESLLRQVFSNLLDNALKYSSKREVARIEVGCTQSQTEITCFIRDNGVGFDMRYADKLFGVFQRLHRVDEFEGTGIGLANVKRIIERHGGRVWAESELGESATFYFTLPQGNTGAG
jgi:signal transduction histidine kinase